MLCKRAIGPCWGFTPTTMNWIYTAAVRLSFTYAAMTWIDGLYKQNNLAKLKSVRRLANILVTGALPLSPVDPLNLITNMIPIDLHTDEEAALGALRLKSSKHWINEPMVNQKGNLTSQDQQTTTLNRDTAFGTEIPTLSEYLETEPNTDTILGYTDGSKVNDKVVLAYTSPTETGVDRLSKCRTTLEKLNRLSSRNFCC